MKAMLSRDEAAAELGVSLGTLDKLLAGGRIPFVKAGRRVLIPAFGIRKYSGRPASGRPRKSALANTSEEIHNAEVSSKIQ